MTESSEVGGRILLVEDEVGVRDAVAEMLTAEGHTVEAVGSGRDACRFLAGSDVEAVMLDLGLPDGDGLEFLTEIRTLDDAAVVVVMTGRDDIATVVEAMRRGAENFLVKPVDGATLCRTVAKAVTQHRLTRHATVYREAVRARNRGDRPGDRELVGRCAAMEVVRDLVARVAPTDSSVVIGGESGTGKGIVARLIHKYSRRAHGPFVDLSCASLPGPLVESELFGHEAGAFTDARTRKPGLFEVAHGGTIFLDEIGELETATQAKLLKALEERRFRRVGGVRDLSVDVRVVVATHQNLGVRVKEGRFRQDLFYRLNVFQIDLPPLRDRGEDVLELAGHFISEFNSLLGRRVRWVDPAAARLLLGYHWPGNVRELRNVIERALILARGDRLLAGHLPRDLHERAAPVGEGGTLESLEAVEAAHIERAVRLCRGNLKLAAERLGIARSTLYQKLERHGLRRD